MTVWDEIGGELDKLAKVRGGAFHLYKPVVRIEVYEHDDEVTVEVGRCKGMDEIIIRKSTWDARKYPELLLALLREARSDAEKPPT